MPDQIGPHLLGRKRAERDERDFPLEAFLDGASTPLELALAAVQKSWVTSSAVKKWAALATAAIEAAAPAPEPPVPPSPDPTPTPEPTPAPDPSTAVLWADTEPVLDQGNTPHCVGFAAAQWGNTLPVDDKWTNADGDALYQECKVIDGEPGQENGSSVHSAAKALQNRGRLTTYAWATTTAAVAQFIHDHGPVDLGIDWTNGMFTPDGNGYISPADGQLAGGHSLVAVGHDPAHDVFTLRNSWGDGWGDHGCARITAADLQKLLDGLDPQYPGEAMAAIELP